MVVVALLVLSPVASVSAKSSTTCVAPTIQLSPASVSGLSVTVDGVSLAGGSSCSITSITWSYGDSTVQTTVGFPGTHAYAIAGFYTVTAIAHQSNGLTASASEQVTVATPIMMNLITYGTPNGYSALKQNINSINEITIFVAQPQNDGEIKYKTGGDLNIPQVISFAHQNGVKVALAVGGNSVPVSTVNKILNSPSLRAKLVSSVATEVASEGYDAVQWDFENQTPGDFSAANYVLLIQEARNAMPNVEFDLVFAPWMTSIDVPALAPYCNYLLYGFPTSGDYTASNLAYWAGEAGGASKLMVGYDLEASDSTYHVPTAADLTLDKSAGYGIFFFEASQMSQASYSEISAAFGSIGTTTIDSVSRINSDIRQTITLTGSGFGTDPQVVPLAGGSEDTLTCDVNTPALAVQDNGAGTDSWTAGLSGCSGTDGIGIDIVSWTNTQIVLGGFGSNIGNSTDPSPNWNINMGDPISIVVYGPNGMEATYIETVGP
jgi:hypothetical protein